MENTTDQTSPAAARQEPPGASPKKESGTELLPELQKAIINKDREIESLKTSSRCLQEDVSRLNTNLAEAVQHYRTMVIKANPEVPEELISGKSVEEVNSSLQNAEKIVEHVKKTLAADEVPVSAPPRAPFNASGLSPREKIQYALGGNS